MQGPTLTFMEDDQSINSSFVAGVPELSEPSEWWWALRNGPGGEESLRSLLTQTLLALHTLHSHNITHRHAFDAISPFPHPWHQRYDDCSRACLVAVEPGDNIVIITCMRACPDLWHILLPLKFSTPAMALRYTSHRSTQQANCQSDLSPLPKC